MKYNIWDIVCLNERLFFWNTNTQSIKKIEGSYEKLTNQEWIILWYETIDAGTIYRVRIIKADYNPRLFDVDNSILNSWNTISPKVFYKMFKRIAPYKIRRCFESKQQYIKQRNKYGDNYTINIIDSKIWERDNDKYNKVLAAIAKAEAKAKAIT